MSPESFTFGESVIIFCMITLGGMGSIPGAILGSVVLVVLPEVLRPVADYRYLLYGLAPDHRDDHATAGTVAEQAAATRTDRRERVERGERVMSDLASPKHAPPGRASSCRSRTCTMKFGGLIAVSDLSFQVFPARSLP